MARPPATKARIPWLSDGTVEAEALLVLADWARDHGAVTEPPVPVDDMVELLLELRFQLEDLRARFRHPDVLGAIWFAERIIRVDRSLDPVEQRPMLGRYRFTVAHEVGHWRLHRKYFLNDAAQLPLGASESPPAFVCRSADQAPEEVQANKFAGFLLMPRDLLRPAWLAWRGRDDVVCVLDLDVPRLSDDPRQNQDAAMQRFCKPLAERFQVSAEAMAYRLEALGLLTRDRSLFG
jgi:hypothetical protein